MCKGGWWLQALGHQPSVSCVHRETSGQGWCVPWFWRWKFDFCGCGKALDHLEVPRGLLEISCQAFHVLWPQMRAKSRAWPGTPRNLVPEGVPVHQSQWMLADCLFCFFYLDVTCCSNKDVLKPRILSLHSFHLLRHQNLLWAFHLEYVCHHWLPILRLPKQMSVIGTSWSKHRNRGFVRQTWAWLSETPMWSATQFLPLDVVYPTHGSICLRGKNPIWQESSWPSAQGQDIALVSPV